MNELLSLDGVKLRILPAAVNLSKSRIILSHGGSAITEWVQDRIAVGSVVRSEAIVSPDILLYLAIFSYFITVDNGQWVIK